MSLKNFISKNKLIYLLFYIVFFSHIFLWDLIHINNASNYSASIPFWILRYLVLFFLLNFFFNEKALDKNFFIIFIIIIFQIIVNLILYNQIINLKEFGSILFFFLLYIVTFYEKDRIISNLKSFFELAILINFLGLIYYLFNDEIRIVNSCNLLLIDNIIFHENSHYAMMMVPIFIYYIFEKINLRNSIFILLLCFNSLIYLSLTLMVGIIVSLLLCLTFLIIHRVKKSYVFYLLLFFLTLLIVQNDCTHRIKYIVDKTNYDIKHTDNNNFNEDKLNKLIINRNLSSEVINIAILNTINTFDKGRIFGWGFNSYYRAYEDNIANIINKYYPKDPSDYELFTLNKSDARSTLLKIINEFGILSLIFLYFAYKFILNKSIDLKYKSTISSLLITQLISGAGYFNGGFAIFLFLMIILSNSNQKLKE
tara:strand:+ start:10499 stop:11773 length:1275 start_codon:yes stop_codon:yes gene_type:complete